MPAANYMLGRIQVQSGGLTSGWFQGAQAQEEFSGGKRVFLYLVSVCACFIPCTSNSTEVVVIRV